jgi:NADPH:quinone reductase-like Zn-dependent oxidoreductase
MSEAMLGNMQAVLLEKRGGPLTVGHIPIPQPGAGEVLIRMAAAPINPSDLGFLQGSYGFQKPFPVVPGFEGSGTVIAAGSGLLPRLLKGRRVACSAASGGTWAEYVVTPASTCFPLIKKLSLEQGATLIVNPLTALAFLNIAQRDKHAAIVSNAAASALGRMILRLGQARRIPILHIVRREEQVQLLRSLGGKYVLNNRDPNFLDRLRALSSQLRATLILDPVAGEQTQQLLSAAPAGSMVLAYGTLSSERTVSAPAVATGADKRIERFYLPDWLAKKTTLQIAADAWRVQRLATNELQTSIHQRWPLSAVQAAIDLYQAEPTAGKMLLVADLEKIHLAG